VEKATDFIKESIEGGPRGQQKTNAQTEAVLESTGHAAQCHRLMRSRSSVDQKLSLKTAVDNDQIQASENMLATFTNIQNRVGKNNDIFTQATKVSTDLAVAMKMGPAKAALQVGKALNDPVKGMTRLQRIGVTFTDAQKKQVAAMVKVGDTAGAQKVILAELTKEFGGSAAAQATASEKFHNSFHLLQEQIGTALLPVLDKMAIYGTKAVAWLQKNPTAMKAILIGIGAIAAAFLVVIAAGAAVEIAIGSVIAGLVYAYTKFKWFHDGVNAVAKGIAAIWVWSWNSVLQPIFKLMVRAIGVQLIAWGTLISTMGHIPGFGWAKKLGDAMKDAGDKALGLANHIDKIPKSHSTKISTPGMDRALSQAQSLKALLGGGKGKKFNVTAPGQFNPDANASGTANFGGGWTKINEKGTEIVELPPGSKVTAHNKSMAKLAAMSGGGDTHITVNISGVIDKDGAAREVREILLAHKRGALAGGSLGLS
jgi:hypothetical protein